MLLIVDGENFRHQIARVLHDRGMIEDMKVFFSFDFTGFCKDVLKTDDLHILYVTTKIEQPDHQVPEQLSERIDAIIDSNRRWIEHLTEQGVEVVKAGYLRVKESNECVHCGRRTLYLQEKGVDVRVATELLLASDKQVPDIVLGSSDSDMIPALEAARRLGVDVKYLCYEEQLNRAVATNAHAAVTFEDEDVLRHFNDEIRDQV